MDESRVCKRQNCAVEFYPRTSKQVYCSLGCLYHDKDRKQPRLIAPNSNRGGRKKKVV